MKCSICGTRIDSVDEAVEEGWMPYFYDGESEHEVACPACTHARLQEGKDGEMEVKEEFQGKLKYLAEGGDGVWQDHSDVVMAVLENEPGELN
jgi:DNA-directed RNA polymerase subunit RPC12/RpoP